MKSPPPLTFGAQRRLANFDYADPNVAFFVTICASHGSPFVDPRLAHEVVSELHRLRSARGVCLYAYCLMPDHIHLLLRLGGDGRTLGQVLGAFKSFTTKQSWGLGHQGPLWQGRFYDHILRRNEDAPTIATYILENPVRRSLVAIASDYPYSGLPDPL